ncbi:hypothetical protein [Priestia endophytica]|uniref:hypothetical protein n=1 Tax=Priestia endophytica TaxID=135735 RepID=UPI000DCA700A|nr:hypothetical protein A4R27_17230 [Priestia endophytica]
MFYICTTCGVQYDSSFQHPKKCVICNDERQYVNPNGQSWTTLEELKDSSYRNIFSQAEEGLYSIKTSPTFAIGQTAYLLQGTEVNILWDCISYLDEETIEYIKSLGGIHAIALSHPHYYSTQVEWAEAFNVPLYIHRDDKQWVMRDSEHIVFWEGSMLKISQDITLYRLGGHFKGGAVLHWGNEDGVLLTGDIVQVVADQHWASFMYSYPNLIPLPASKVSEMVEQLKPLHFDRLYNAFHRSVKEDANRAVQRSAERYIKALDGSLLNI